MTEATNAAGSGNGSSQTEESAKCLRWRKIAVDQLSYALNLFLTSAVAAIGFCFALLKDKDFSLPSCSARCAMFLSILAFFASGVFAYCCVLYRYKDFHETARRACDHSNKLSKDEVRKARRKSLEHLPLYRLGIWSRRGILSDHTYAYIQGEALPLKFKTATIFESLSSCAAGGNSGTDGTFT